MQYATDIKLELICFARKEKDCYSTVFKNPEVDHDLVTVYRRRTVRSD